MTTASTRHRFYCSSSRSPRPFLFFHRLSRVQRLRGPALGRGADSLKKKKRSKKKSWEKRLWIWCQSLRLASLIKSVWLGEIGSLLAGKENRKGPNKQSRMAPAEQKNSPVRCDLVTVGQYQLRQTHKWKKVERQRLGFIFVHIFACAPKQEVSVFRPIVAFLWCSCSYCVYSTNGLLFLSLSSPPFFSHIISMYSPGSWLKGFLAGVRGEERREERRGEEEGGDGSVEEWSLLPHMSGQERVEWRSSSS